MSPAELANESAEFFMGLDRDAAEALVNAIQTFRKTDKSNQDEIDSLESYVIDLTNKANEAENENNKLERQIIGFKGFFFQALSRGIPVLGLSEEEKVSKWRTLLDHDDYGNVFNPETNEETTTA